MKVNFETERLIIRPLVPDDAEAAFRWCGDPNVNTYMIYPLYHRMEDVRTWLEAGTWMIPMTMTKASV